MSSFDAVDVPALLAGGRPEQHKFVVRTVRDVALRATS
jgi:hypothetical protein